MNVLSLFSGIGGLELGLERAGMRVVGQVELDPFCRRVLSKHWPEVPKHDDVRTAVEWWESEPRPAVHVVAGGFPCQPFSLAGRRLGTADERWLWPAFRDVIRRLRPRYALMENVPGLLVRGAGDVLGDLAEIGYDAEWDCIPAAAVGAPHRRDRVFVVAYPQRDGVRHEPVAESGGVGPPFALADAAPVLVADADGPGLEGVGIRGPASECRGEVAHPAGDRRGARRAGRPVGDGPVRPAVWPQALAHAEGQRRAALWPYGASEAGADNLARHAGQRTGEDAWATEPDVGRVAYGVPARVDRLRGLGNAVVPQVAEHIGRLIVAADLGVSS